MDYLRSDCILREILEDRKTLMGFLDAIFGFLSRNTDFYNIQTITNDQVGFPKGVKEQILMSCMQKYEYTSDQPKHAAVVDESPMLVAEEVEIETDSSYEQCVHSVNESNDTEGHETEKGTVCFSNNSKFLESEYKNGSVCENYCWSQTLKDVELSVLLPKEIKLAKHIRVEMKSNYITITTLLPKEEILLNCETWDKFRHNDVIWSILEGKLVICFDKFRECWWDKLFLNETSINTKNINCESSITEYSQDVQNALEKVFIQEGRHDQDLKSVPVKESEEMKRLRQAWNAEGSPFKGQPFDPSLIQFN